MNSQKKLSLFILLALKGLLSIQTTFASTHDDITSNLRQWITEIFEAHPSSASINSIVRGAFASAEHHRITEFEHNLSDEFEPFRSKFYFHDINFYTHSEDAARTKPFRLTGWNASNIVIATEYLRITLECDLRAKKDEPYTSLFTTLNFHDFVLNAIQSSKDSNEPKISFNISYGSYNARNNEYYVNIKWMTGNLSDDQQTTLSNRIEPLLPILLREHINQNPEFSKAFESAALAYPVFLNEEHKPHYLIPKIPIFDFNLKEVVLQGFSNIERFDFRDERDDDDNNDDDDDDSDVSHNSYRSDNDYSNNNFDSFDNNNSDDDDDDDSRSSSDSNNNNNNNEDNGDVFSRNLLFKNLSGELILDYGTEQEKPLELSFSIDYLSISTCMKSNVVRVEARSYCVNRTKDGEPLTYRQSAMIMQKIESGLASTLFPAKKAWKTIDLESKINPINTANEEWKVIQRLYSDWIPFNKDSKRTPLKNKKRVD